MVKISGFHLDSQETAVDAFGVAFFIVDTGDVAAAVGDDPGDLLQLTRLVDQLDQQTGGAAGIQQAPVDDPGETGHIDVAAGNHRHHPLAF